MTHSTNRELIAEWLPLFNPLDLDIWTVLLVLLLLSALLFAWLLAQRKWATIGDLPAWMWLLSCLPLTWMAFHSIRHVPLMAIWTAPVVSLLAQAAASRWGRAKAWQTGWVAVIGLISLPVLLGVILGLSRPAPRIAAGRFPFEAAEFMRANKLHGNVYAPLWWGSFLTWQLYPDVRVAMDGRNVTLFPSAMVRENLLYVLPRGADPDLPLHYPTDYLLMPRDAMVIENLRYDPRWQVLHADSIAILFVRADRAHADVVRRYREGDLVNPATPIPQYFE